MRIISTEAMQTLSQAYGVEPVTIIKVYWSTLQAVLYANHTILPTIKGAILEISAFDDVVNFDGNKATQTFNITLDDVDGSIKAIYDVHDIHKAKVQVFQWFSNIPLSDMFLIFDGEINSPVIWREGERNLTFSVVSQIEDQEIGFSPEEGLFDEIPDDLIGKPFPLIFGFARNVPAIKLDPIPMGILLDTLVIPDPSIAKQIASLTRKLSALQLAAILDFYKAIEAYFSGTEQGGFDVDEYWQGIGDQYLAAGNQLLQQIWQIEQKMQTLQETSNKQRGLQKKSLRVHQGGCFPQGEDASTTLANGSLLTGQFAGGDFQINGAVHPFADNAGFGEITPVPIERSSQIGGTIDIVQKLGLIWEPSDQPFKLTSPIPIRYICCMLECSVLNVWAYRNYNDTRLLMQVPPEYYSVNFESFGTMPITVITLALPLSYYDSKWDDTLYVDLQSSIGPNTVSILIWLIENYTMKGIDSTSFNHVAALVSGVPSNFAMLHQENIIKALSDIAYQSRCALLLKNDVFYLKFLPEQPTPVATITLDDILVNTLELNHSSTENLITKLTGDWLPSYEGAKSNKVIIRNNTIKYGIHQQSVNWYIYTNPGLVDLGASFWCIRKSNTWKLIKFKTPLTKIALESFDAVTINFATNWVCNGPVIGIIESIKFNTKELNLEFEVWLPILLGTMTQYNFAWPPNSDVDVNPANIDFQKIGYDATGNLGSENGASNCNQSASVKKGGRKKITHPTAATPSDASSIILAPASGGLDPSKKPNLPYDYDQPETPQVTSIPLPQGAFPGIITDNSAAPMYSARAYLRGVESPARGSLTTVTDVTNGPALPVGSWITVIALAWTVPVTGGRSRDETRRYLIPSSSTNTFIGKIVESIDSFTYTVALYTQGITNPSTSMVTVKQLQINPTDTIPTDTWVIVVLNQTKNDMGATVPEYTMQVPVYIQ